MMSAGVSPVPPPPPPPMLALSGGETGSVGVREPSWDVAGLLCPLTPTPTPTAVPTTQQAAMTEAMITICAVTDRFQHHKVQDRDMCEARRQRSSVMSHKAIGQAAMPDMSGSCALHACNAAAQQWKSAASPCVPSE